MERKVLPEMKKYTVKITNLPFDDVLGMEICKRKYFTIENNDIIYKKMKELDIRYLPYLGVQVEFGLGDLVLEEGKNKFRVYTIDRMTKFGTKEFNNVVDAIGEIINEMIQIEPNIDKELLENIFFETLKIEKNKVKKYK